MNSKKSPKTIVGAKEKITKQELKERIEAKLITRGIFNAQSATPEQLYQASFLALKDIMLEYRESFKKRIKETNGKKICYLCMEFLVGRALKNDSMNLGVYNELCEVLEDCGSSFEKDYACEDDPGLGNGGLRPLAS